MLARRHRAGHPDRRSSPAGSRWSDRVSPKVAARWAWSTVPVSSSASAPPTGLAGSLGFHSPAGYLSAGQVQLTGSRVRSEEALGFHHAGQAGGLKGPDRAGPHGTSWTCRGRSTKLAARKGNHETASGDL